MGVDKAYSFKIDGIVWKYRKGVRGYKDSAKSFKIDGIVWKFSDLKRNQALGRSFKIDGIVWK